MKGARYVIAEDDFMGEFPLVIRDVGPWDKHLTVTNDAVAVVEQLVAAGQLHGGRRLYYYNSEGRLDEVVIANGRFAGFVRGGADATP